MIRIVALLFALHVLLPNPVAGQSMHIRAGASTPFSGGEVKINDLYSTGYVMELGISLPWIEHDLVHVNLDGTASFSGYSPRSSRTVGLETLHMAIGSARLRITGSAQQSIVVETGGGITRLAAGFRGAPNRQVLQGALGGVEATEAAVVGGLGYQWPIGEETTLYIMAEYQRITGEVGINMLVGKLGIALGRL